MRAMVSLAVFVVVLSCAPLGHPVLEVTLSPKSVGDATPVKVRVVGTNAAGLIGTGMVKISSAAGSLTTAAEVLLDKYGTVTADLSCDPRVEPDCALPVKVKATWTSDKEVATAEAILNSGGSVGAGGGSGGTGTGGGSGAGGGGTPVFAPGTLIVTGSVGAQCLGSCEGYARLDSPQTVVVGSINGGIVYTSQGVFQWANFQVRRLVPDSLSMDPATNRYIYPTNFSANDVLASTPACARPTRIYPMAGSDFVYSCESGGFFHGQTRIAGLPPADSAFHLYAFGYGALVFVYGSATSTPLLLDGNGTSIPFQNDLAIAASQVATVVARADGFLYCATGNRVRLLHPDGSQETLGTFDSSITSCDGLDAAGNVYQHMSDTLMKAPPDGSSPTVAFRTGTTNWTTGVLALERINNLSLELIP